MEAVRSLKRSALALAATLGLAVAGSSIGNAQNKDFHYKPVSAKVEDASKRHKGLELVLETDVNGDGKKEKLLFTEDGSAFVGAEGGLVKRRNKDFFMSRKTGRSVTIFSKGRTKYALHLDPKSQKGAIVPLEDLKKGPGQYVMVLSDTPNKGAYIYKSADRKFAPMMNLNFDKAAAKEFFDTYAPEMRPFLPKDESPAAVQAPKKEDEKKEEPLEQKVAEPVAEKKVEKKQAKAPSHYGLVLLNSKACPLGENRADIEKAVVAYAPELAAHIKDVYTSIAPTAPKKGSEFYGVVQRSIATHLSSDTQRIDPKGKCVDLLYTFKDGKVVKMDFEVKVVADKPAKGSIDAYVKILEE